MVFDKGELIECDKPGKLLKDPGSMFADMAKHAPGLKPGAVDDSDEETTSGLETTTEDIVQINGLL